MASSTTHDVEELQEVFRNISRAFESSLGPEYQERLMRRRNNNNQN